MSRLNVAVNHAPIFTHEGGKAALHLSPIQMLRRSVMSCMLWENEFYEDGATISDRIIEYAKLVSPETLAALAVEVRTEGKLRHVPLLLTAVLAGLSRGTSLTKETLAKVIRRPDELGEFLAIYARVNKVAPADLKPYLSNQVRKGLAAAFAGFNEYQLAKYNREVHFNLRNVMFMVHPKPRDDGQAAVWRTIIDEVLPPADTWEHALSEGGDKRETFDRLLREGKLGYMALLRNLRNMAQSGVDHALIEDAILARKGAHVVLPFRYVAAARAAPQFERALDTALAQAIADLPPLDGITVVVVDVSGSMSDPVSGKSDMTRMDAAASLASIINARNLRVFSFSNGLVECPARRGMAGVDAIQKSQPHHGTAMAEALALLQQVVPYHDRMIVITDEQAYPGTIPPPRCQHAYMINVASARNGVGYGPWKHLDGWSERVLSWIVEFEKGPQADALEAA